MQKHLPKITFDDPYFKNMMIFQAGVGGGTKGQKYPQLTKQMLLEYVKSEYAIFCFFLNLMTDMECKQIYWNAFSQGIHYGIMLFNK